MNGKIPKWFREGLKVICNITEPYESEVYKIYDARLHYEYGIWFLCQNEVGGHLCKNKLGYNYVWGIGRGTYEELEKTYWVTNLRPALDKKLLQQIKKEILK